MLIGKVPGRIPSAEAGEPSATRWISIPAGCGRLKRPATRPARRIPSTPVQKVARPSSSWRATFEAMAKLSPSNPPERERMWLTIPTTSPSMLNTGPPEFPAFTAASVCSSSSRIPPIIPPAVRRPLI